MTFVPQKLQEAAELLLKGETPPRVTPRELLRWFGAQRRGYYVTRGIKAALRDVALQTDPPFATAWIDEPLLFVRLPPLDTKKTDDRLGADAVDSSRGRQDPTYRIGRLKAAHQPPVWVPPTCSIAEAATLMISHDFSQLPVMQNDRMVKGLVSWLTIGRTLVLGGSPATVNQCMVVHREVSEDDSLFSVIQEIIACECVLVRNRSQKVIGIITTADLSDQFAQLTEPFMLIGEIENHVRDVLDASFTPAELAEFGEGDSVIRDCRGACDLTFGGYQRVLENPSRWSRSGLTVDRAVFIRDLDSVRTTRNEIVHFDPDGISENAIAQLRRFTRVLRLLRPPATTEA